MVKRVVAAILAVALAVFPAVNVSAYSGTGSGTPSDPFRIRTCQQIFEINSNLSAHYVLENDVDCSTATWTHIGTLTSAAFSGTLDGQGYAISNLTVNDTAGVGLFTYIDGATVTNLYLDTFDITGTGTVGTLAARADNATISHVHAINSTVRSEYATGGLIGILNTSTVSDSSVSGVTVTGRASASFARQIGGFVGLSTDNSYNRSSSAGAVDATTVSAATIEDTGGFLGYATGDIVSDSYSTANVAGDINVGGFVGNHASSVFYRSYASGSVTGNSRVGGFSGMSALSMLQHSFATGAISANTMDGGLIGRVQAIGGDVDGSTWDVTRTGVANCVGADQGISYPTTCLSGVNVASAQPDYFFNTTSNAPLNNWNFSTVWRTTATGLPLLQVTPQRVDNVRVTPGSSSLRVRWEVPADIGGSAITSYDLKFRPSLSQVYTTVSSIAATAAPEYTITGLSSNTEYTVEVRARNAVGQGLWLGFITKTNTAVAVPMNTATTGFTEEQAVALTDTILDTNDQSEERSLTAQDDVKSESEKTSVINPVLVVVISVVVIGSIVLLVRLIVIRQ